MRLHGSAPMRGVTAPILGRVTVTPVSHLADRRRSVALVRTPGGAACPDGWHDYAAVITTFREPRIAVADAPVVYGPVGLEYLDEGDIVLISPGGHVNVLYRRRSSHNTILVTERCNSYCVMCSQPPRDVDDSARVDQILQMTDLIDPNTAEIGLSGGEPTLAGEGFLDIVRAFRKRLPRTALHILTNGRSFRDSDFAASLADIGHPDLMLGIPLYSDNPSEHDHVVQARGAFEETVEGLYNLARHGVMLEVRVVLHAMTVARLPQLAEFIYRNLTFVHQVALMGLEPFGFAARNFGALWVDPVDYQPELEEATLGLAMRGMKVSIYNHQLCTLPRVLWPFARKSISDWKNVYLPVCDRCEVRDYCTGFFHSATKRHSAHIAPEGRPSSATAAALAIYSGAADVEHLPTKHIGAPGQEGSTGDGSRPGG